MPRKLMQAALGSADQLIYSPLFVLSKNICLRRISKQIKKLKKPKLPLDPCHLHCIDYIFFRVQVKQYEEMKIQHKCLLKYLFNPILTFIKK